MSTPPDDASIFHQNSPNTGIGVRAVQALFRKHQSLTHEGKILLSRHDSDRLPVGTSASFIRASPR
ncbi:hypothetical protein GGI1_14933 [Acidithiobacillus sp. GGI-221]|nr:hypothetical protein GGI1_14933 [Acidithiobacillus sp. GGI-221]